jgi:uncharacterized membrane protein
MVDLGGFAPPSRTPFSLLHTAITYSIYLFELVVNDFGINNIVDLRVLDTAVNTSRLTKPRKGLLFWRNHGNKNKNNSKSLIFRVVAFSVTAPFVGVKIAIGLQLFLLCAYYIHERLWMKVSWGKVHPQ